MRGNGIIIHGGIVIFGAQGKQVRCLREPVAVCVEPRAIYVTGSLPKKAYRGRRRGALETRAGRPGTKTTLCREKARSALSAQAAERADTKKEFLWTKRRKSL